MVNDTEFLKAWEQAELRAEIAEFRLRGAEAEIKRLMQEIDRLEFRK